MSFKMWTLKAVFTIVIAWSCFQCCHAAINFSPSTYSVSVKENTAGGTTLTTVIASGAVGPVTYSFDDNTVFDIDVSGQITLNVAVDYEAGQTSYVLKETAIDTSDSTSASATVSITITDVNDNPPVCTRTNVYRALDENTSSGTTVYILSCSDKDSSTNGNNQLQYTLTTGNTYFSISSAGVITTSGTALDYETDKQHTLNVQVSDQASAESKLSTSVTVVVYVTPLNDNNPVWSGTMPATYSKSENVGLGTTVFTLSATDADVDVGGTLTYSIFSVTESKSVTEMPKSILAAGSFAVDSYTGDVTTMVLLDRDNGVDYYLFIVQVTDGGSGSHILTSTVTVSIDGYNDIAPVFASTPYSVVTKQETSAKAGSLVLAVSATDGDVGTTATFTFTVKKVKVGSSTESDWKFTSTASGADLSFQNDYDLDTAGTSALTILELIVSDGGSPALTGTTSLTISIIADNEFTPTIQSQTTSPISIPEDTSVGTSIAKFTGSDNDIGAEGVLAYSFSLTNSPVCPSNPFSIDSSGTITVSSELNFDTCPQYIIQVEIKDSGVSPKSVSGTLTVSITDVNNHQPTCTVLYKTVPLSETAVVNAQVTTISCSDADTGDTLTYTALTNADTFGFTGNQMKLLKAVDYDSTTQYYDVDVQVSDGINKQTVKVRVILDHENEHTPAFATNRTVSVTENDMSHPELLTYTATDIDYSPDNIVAYEIQSGKYKNKQIMASRLTPSSSLFGIDVSSGKISLKSPLDHENVKVYELQIIAKDGGNLKGTGTVTVSVLDVNDNAPTCPQYTYVQTVPENQSPGVIVNNLGCTDSDGTTINYYLPSGSPFSIPSGTDNVNLDATLDYESTSSYTLTVSVTDSGNPVLSSTILIYVDVVNVNDGGPTFPATVLSVPLDEDVAIGTSVAGKRDREEATSSPYFLDSLGGFEPRTVPHLHSPSIFQ
ncbi:hypothetical protein Btru_038491 [Bulinus truncatus]|nr:hypothetical protein Btru_038491 [Bulinus truncatus]